MGLMDFGLGAAAAPATGGLSLAIPIISALGQGLQGYLQNKAQNQQQQQSQDALAVQQQRLQYERQQQVRQNAMQDSQSATLNPMRQQILQSLGGRLGLPSGALNFHVSAPAVARQRAQQSQQTAMAQTQQDSALQKQISDLQQTIATFPPWGPRQLRAGLEQQLATLLHQQQGGTG